MNDITIDNGWLKFVDTEGEKLVYWPYLRKPEWKIICWNIEETPKKLINFAGIKNLLQMTTNMNIKKDLMYYHIIYNHTLLKNS